MSFGFTNRKQQKDDPPAEINPKKPKMGVRPLRARRIKGAIVEMPSPEHLGSAEETDPGLVKPRRNAPIKKGVAATAKERKKLNLMPPLPKKKQTKEVTEEDAPMQGEETPVRAKATQAKEGYIRLRMRVKDGEVSVVDVGSAEGPLAEGRQLHAGLNYEVMCGKKQIGVGTIHDGGLKRGFPEPNATGQKSRHSITELADFEFTARIPKKELSASLLPRVKVNVYRTKGDVPKRPVTSEPLEVQFKQELRKVAQLKGIKAQKLSKRLHQKIVKAVR